MAWLSDGGGGGSTKSKYKPRSNYKPRGNSGGYEPRGGSSSVSRRLSNYGGGSISSNSSGRYSPPMNVPGMAPGGGPVPDINAYLGGDTGYQQQLREFAKALADFNADVTRRRGTLDQEYGSSKKALGDQRLLDLEGIEDDYASRGLQRSGLYADAVGDYEKEFGTRMSELERRQKQAIQQLLNEQSQYKNQNLLSQQTARENALRRRSEQYGI